MRSLCFLLALTFSAVLAPIAGAVPFVATGSFDASTPNSANVPQNFSGSFSFKFDLDPFASVSLGNYPFTALTLTPSTIGSTVFDETNVRGLAANDLATPEVRISIGGTINGAGAVVGTDDFFATFRLSGVTLQDALNTSLALPLSALLVSNTADNFFATYDVVTGEVVISTVSEPDTLALFALGFSALAGLRRRRTAGRRLG